MRSEDVGRPTKSTLSVTDDHAMDTDSRCRASLLNFISEHRFSLSLALLLPNVASSSGS